jgi:signal transduction histidine kinase
MSRAKELNMHLPKGNPRFNPPQDKKKAFLNCEQCMQELNKDLQTAKNRIKINLAVINGIILSFSGIGAYYLAGITLQPIKKALNKQKKFIADASHEFRTPLTVLKTTTEVALKNKALEDNSREILQSNLEEINYLQKLADKLLRLANYEKNGTTFQFTQLNLKKIIQQALKRIKPLAEDKNIALKTELENCPIKGNPEKLLEMTLIFLDNAIKYNQTNGSVTVSLSKNKHKAVFRIKDDGIGIAEKDLPQIFNRFYRTDQARSNDKVNGFGLGLSLAKQIINIHQGTISVDSKTDNGTTFTITFPLDN